MSTVYTDIRYGKHERHVLDVYLADSASGAATPAVIFLHGGGYVNGDKSAVTSRGLFQVCMKAGITVISGNYRFITTDPFPAPMQDGTRIIQFVRHMAEEWNIDPGRIAVSGSSAGAHIVLWNGMKGDLSNPASDDPIERVSSAVSAILTFDGQVTKDQYFYKEHYLGDKLQPNICLYYGIDHPDRLEDPDIRKLSYEASAIHFVTPDAPPVFTWYNIDFGPVPIPADTPISQVIHHPLHGYTLKKVMDSYGRPCVFRHAGDPLREGELLQFLTESFREPVGAGSA
ncbi:hypothetical protein PAESOLCIP111_01838 [Paenibacillus solanacearum]|uniref:BD-FAE-like domain-containing protein n=1 Tax=Paenibacillus solanacearum TaxID=2048548 RepID=A0A916NNX8_9BACL|nr:hypothetical protein PAESOLCIP111_01838 [Paenibacillus solanacearum]